MSARFPPIPKDKQTSDQRKQYDLMTQEAENTFGDKFVYKNDEGEFIGPFGPLLYTPTLVQPFMELVIAAGKIPGLPATARETAILATGSTFKAGYELYAHGKVAAGTNLSQSQIELIKKGYKPGPDERLDEASDVAFDVALELSRHQGPMSEELWQRGNKILGQQGMAALIHYVGLYAYTSIFLNGVEATVPIEEQKS